MIKLGKNAQRKVRDYALSRYSCYLIVMNGDPQKEIIAVGQTYFAVKTRQQELIDDYDSLTENQRRAEMKKHNKSLAEAAQMAGVKQLLISPYSKTRATRACMADLASVKLPPKRD